MTNPKSQPVLLNGAWVQSHESSFFQAMNPNSGELLEAQFPISSWEDCEVALNSATEAFWKLKQLPASAVAEFLEEFASRIETAKAMLVSKAHEETGLPATPRLGEVELPRTVNQLRLAAAAARSGDWAHPIIDRPSKIRSCFESLGPVLVFGPNNFPFAFGSVSGGDFAAAIAAGNPVIGKANSSHPGTTQIFAELALEAIKNTGMPAGLVQLLYRTSHEDGERLVSDARVGATGYTGSRHAGLKLKSVADAVGKPIYLELSSVNPVVILPGALRERGAALVEEYATSGLMGAGQFCTNPGLVLLVDSPESKTWLEGIRAKYAGAPAGTLLSKGVQQSLSKGIQILVKAGAELLSGGSPLEGNRCAVANTLMHASGSKFLEDPNTFQTEVFGNASLVISCGSLGELESVLMHLEGNLTGCIYSDTQGSDDEAYHKLAPILATKVGRILNDKMPTGVAVSPAMNHGGPFPSTGHPGFTAVGIPTSMPRFAKLSSYDNVREPRLPWLLRDKNPTGTTWRCIDGHWSQGDC